MKLCYRQGGTFGITIYRNRNMNGQMYNDLLVNSVIPELKRDQWWNLRSHDMAAGHEFGKYLMMNTNKNTKH